MRGCGCAMSSENTEKFAEQGHGFEVYYDRDEPRLEGGGEETPRRTTGSDG